MKKKWTFCLFIMLWPSATVCTYQYASYSTFQLSKCCSACSNVFLLSSRNINKLYHVIWWLHDSDFKVISGMITSRHCRYDGAYFHAVEMLMFKNYGFAKQRVREWQRYNLDEKKMFDIALLDLLKNKIKRHGVMDRGSIIEENNICFRSVLYYDIPVAQMEERRSSPRFVLALS